MYTSEQIEQCMRKVRVIQLHQTLVLSECIEITPYYAGHVLGACMFHIRVGSHSIVYTVRPLM